MARAACDARHRSVARPARHPAAVVPAGVNEILRLIGSHNVFATPTAAQMADKDCGL